MTRRGASRCRTTAAGQTSAGPGAGSPVRFARRRSMRPRWSHSSAAAISSWRFPAAMSAGVAWFPLGPRDVYRPSYPVSRKLFQQHQHQQHDDQQHQHHQRVQQHQRTQHHLRQPAGARRGRRRAEHRVRAIAAGREGRGPAVERGDRESAGHGSRRGSAGPGQRARRGGTGQQAAGGSAETAGRGESTAAARAGPVCGKTVTHSRRSPAGRSMQQRWRP